MRIPKRYGESRIEGCPFCKRQAITVSEEGVSVCTEHKNSKVPELKCLCSRPLEMRKGKFGIFFNCISCGNMNSKRAFEINTIPQGQVAVKKETEQSPRPTREVREVVIRADDPLYFD